MSAAEKLKGSEVLKKSPLKIVELFIYAVILAAAIIWAVNRGGFYVPSADVRASPPPTVSATVQPHETPPLDISIYNPPPAAENEN